MWEMDTIVIITTIIHTVQTDTVSNMVRTNQQYGQNMYGNGANQQYGQNMYGNGANQQYGQNMYGNGANQQYGQNMYGNGTNQQYGQNMYGNGTAQGGDARNSYGTSQQQSWNDEYNNKDYE